MPIGTARADVRFFLGRSRAVRTGDIGFFLGLGFYFLAGWGCFQLCTFENNTAHNGLGNLFVACLSHSYKSMVEQADAGKGHGYAVLITSGDYMVVAHAAAGLGHIFHTTLMGTFNVVAKGEECI